MKREKSDDDIGGFGSDGSIGSACEEQDGADNAVDSAVSGGADSSDIGEKGAKSGGRKNEGSMACTYRGVSRAQAKKITSLVFEKLRQAIEEIDTQLITTTTKTKVIEYNLESKPDKPTKEILTETEEQHAVKGVVDRQGLKQITAILKELKDISLFNAELDFKEQQARVSNLLLQGRSGDDEGVSCGVIIMPAKEMDANISNDKELI